MTTHKEIREYPRSGAMLPREFFTEYLCRCGGAIHSVCRQVADDAR